MTRLARRLLRLLPARRVPAPCPSPDGETETVVVAAPFDFDGPLDPWADEAEMVTLAVAVGPTGVIRWEYQIEDTHTPASGPTSHPSAA